MTFHCDCGIGEAGPGEIKHHQWGCGLFRRDTDAWRAAHAEMLAANETKS